MRGKHANAAERRRQVAELEQRADQAEHRAEKAEAEIRDLKERLARTTTGLQRELAGMRKQRDEAAAPAVAALEELLAKLREQRDEALQKADFQEKRHFDVFVAFKRALMKMGFSHTEAVEIVAATSSDIDDNWRLIDGGEDELTGPALDRYRHDAEAINRLQTAQGVRRNEGAKKALIEAVNADDEDGGA